MESFRTFLQGRKTYLTAASAVILSLLGYADGQIKFVWCVATLESLDRQQAVEYDRLVRVNSRPRVFRRSWPRRWIGSVVRASCEEGTQNG